MTTTTAPGSAEHTCTKCSALPEAPAGWRPAKGTTYVAAGYRPRAPRPAPHGGVRSLRCDEHEREHKAATRKRAAETRRLRVYGIDADQQADLRDYQHGRCPCGRSIDKPQTDHSHEGAARHDHPLDRGCPDCLRGYLCWQCNREIVGRFEELFGEAGAVDALLRLVAFLLDPPYQRLRRGEPPLPAPPRPHTTTVPADPGVAA